MRGVGLFIGANAASNLSYGEIVLFGSYPQNPVSDPALITQLNGIGQGDDVPLGGARYAYKNGGWFLYEPIEWRVLEKDESSAYLLADKVLDAGALTRWDDASDKMQDLLSSANNPIITITSNNISLYLPLMLGDFAARAFGPQLSMLQPMSVTCKYEVNGGVVGSIAGLFIDPSLTFDTPIFIPTAQEVSKPAFGPFRVAAPTEYATAAGVYTNGPRARWWTFDTNRIPSYFRIYSGTVSLADSVTPGTGIDFNGNAYSSNLTNVVAPYNNVRMDNKMGVRPVIKVDASALYSVTYNANAGGDPVGNMPAAQVKAIDIPLTLSSTAPTREGYNFTGWATTASAGVAKYKVNVPATYTDNAPLELYAVWAREIYDFTFHTNNTVRPTIVEEAYYDSPFYLNSLLETPAYKKALTRESCVFMGWSTSPGAATADYPPDGVITGINQNADFYAVWDFEQPVVAYPGQPKELNSNVYVSPASAFPAGTILYAQTGTNDWLMSRLDDPLDPESEIWVIKYEIKFKIPGNNYSVPGKDTEQPSGMVTVRLLIPPEFLDKFLTVQHGNPNALFVIHNWTDEHGVAHTETIYPDVVPANPAPGEPCYLVFETDHFSEYVIQWAWKAPGGGGNQGGNNKGNDTQTPGNSNQIPGGDQNPGNDNQVPGGDDQTLGSDNQAPGSDNQAPDSNNNDDTSAATLKWWQRLPPWVQWILRILAFGWIWMK